MKAVILNYRGSYKQQKACNQVIIHIDSVTSKKDAEKLISKSVTWSNMRGKPIHGKISGAHGNSGAVRAIFDKGIPGQALGKEVKIE